MSGEIQPLSPRLALALIVSPQCFAATGKQSLKFSRSEHPGISARAFSSSSVGCQRSEVHWYVPPAGTLVLLDDSFVTCSTTRRWQHCSIPNPPFAPEKNLPLRFAVTS